MSTNTTKKARETVAAAKGNHGDNASEVVKEALKKYAEEYGTDKLRSQISHYIGSGAGVDVNAKAGLSTKSPDSLKAGELRVATTGTRIDDPIWEARSRVEGLFRLKEERKLLDEKIWAEEDRFKNFIRENSESLPLKSRFLRDTIELVNLWLSIYRNPRVSRGDASADREQQLRVQHENADRIASRLERIGYKLDKRYMLDMTDIGEQLREILWKEPRSDDSKEHIRWDALVNEVVAMVSEDIIRMDEVLKIYQKKEGKNV